MQIILAVEYLIFIPVHYLLHALSAGHPEALILGSQNLPRAPAGTATEGVPLRPVPGCVGRGPDSGKGPFREFGLGKMTPPPPKTTTYPTTPPQLLRSRATT